MAWFTRIDRFGDSHLCFSQEDTDSCGLASSKMVLFKVNKLRPGHAAVTTENNVATIYKKYDSTAVNVGSEGVFFNQMHRVLNDLDIGTWVHDAPANQAIPDLLISKLGPDIMGLGPINSLKRGLPMLLKVQWGGSPSHVVVLDNITRVLGSSTYYAAICDPADGDVHITSFSKGKQIEYRGRRVTFSVNFGGTASQNYAAGQNSQGVITEAVYCTTPP